MGGQAILEGLPVSESGETGGMTGGSGLPRGTAGGVPKEWDQSRSRTLVQINKLLASAPNLVSSSVCLLLACLCDSVRMHWFKKTRGFVCMHADACVCMHG